MPTFTTLFSPKVEVWRHRLVPHSPQKEVVTSAPESAFFVHVLGVPDVIWKPVLGTIYRAKGSSQLGVSDIILGSTLWSRTTLVL
jgi:hypothetical protein